LQVWLGGGACALGRLWSAVVVLRCRECRKPLAITGEWQAQRPEDIIVSLTSSQSLSVAKHRDGGSVGGA
jgi:hypothetical protein